MNVSYSDFLRHKSITDPSTGLDPTPINNQLFDFQRDIDLWALRRGRAAIFADCGLGKTPMQLEWARQVGDVLILAPLAVAKQTVREGEKFGVPVHYCRSQDMAKPGVNITNYEMLEHFDPSKWRGVVLDESSILKAYDGKTRTRIIEAFRDVPFRLACTATPAPNDFMELGNHAEFLGTMKRSEMLSMFFVHDGGETQKWRLKGHAESAFWRWLCSWAVMVRKPSDLGYEDRDFILPGIIHHETIVRVDAPTDGMLFALEAQSLHERIRARGDTVGERVAAAAALANGNKKTWIMWCGRNDESAALVKAIPDAVEITGSNSLDEKEDRMMRFSNGDIRVLVTKPSIAGFGMNWQHCSNVAFVGLSDSWESYYQAVRRCWRFGQKKTVNVHIITAETEGAVLANIKRKEEDAARMAENMVTHMSDLNKDALNGASSRDRSPYVEDIASGPDWSLHLGDCVEVVAGMSDASIDYSIYSPPFSSLYTYSNSDRDMGNCRGDDEFFDHYRFLVREIFRATKPGRLTSFHCMNLPTNKTHHGHIGLRDFRGDLIRAHEAEGWIYHSEVVIWKDPVTAMQRTKAIGLLHKQLKKDSTLSRQGIPDYLVTMRKPGENVDRVTHDNENFPVSEWQKIASPIWMDINPSDTLQYRSARDHKDERHIAPLQLEVIRRALRLWSNPNDLVLSPFAGIGSEGYVALQMGRRFVGVELKPSYWRQGQKNIAIAHQDLGGLFSSASTDDGT